VTKVDSDRDHPIVFIGPFEHQSNEVLWCESQADVIVIPKNPETGLIDLEKLQEELEMHQHRTLKIASFLAASNVTGIRSDTKATAKILHAYGAKVCFDFAAAGPHVTMDMKGHDLDIMYLSIHKFFSGAGPPGLLVACHLYLPMICLLFLEVVQSASSSRIIDTNIWMTLGVEKKAESQLLLKVYELVLPCSCIPRSVRAVSNKSRSGT
jgi:selenocysteine lyase/cysteine desulfurase